ALPTRGRTPRTADSAAGGRARQAHRAGRHGRQDAHDPVESAPRGLDREELPQPGPAVPRPDPGRNARVDPRGGEVRLAPGLQVLDLRHVVDPPGGRPRARRQGADDPDAGAHRRAPAEDESRGADAVDAEQTKPLEEGGSRLGLTRTRVRQIELESLRRLSALREMQSMTA